MSGRLHWGLRGRLVLAFILVALLGTLLATVYTSLTLDAHVSAAARARLSRAATHFGDVAAVLSTDGAWAPEDVATLHHLTQIDSLAARLVDASGQIVFTQPASAAVELGASAYAPVVVDGREIGRVTVSPGDGRLLTAEELQLRSDLSRIQVVAGVASAAIALVVALYLALTLSRPLRSIRSGAEAMSAGDLATLVPEAGDDEIRSVARALNRLAETLQLEEGLRKESVADLAHELRTPVMGLLGRIEAAQDSVFEDEAANLAAMHAEALRLTRLLDDLSALADAERPGLLLTSEPVDLAAVVADQVAAFADRFVDKGIELSSDLASTTVSGDRRRLEQIVVNLLSNALKYTEAGGRVDVTVRQAGDEVVLDVADTGIGIAADDVPRVFTRFWRGEKSRSRATGGAGIGLSIVQALVGAHGGRITVESEAGVGSVFRVFLPAVGPQRLH